MRRKLLTLITLLCLAVLTASTAYAGKIYKINQPKKDSSSFNTDNVSADTLLQFAQTLIGVPYRAASSDPQRGFDCSGFVNYVFENFNFDVPRCSRDFINVGEKVSLADARPGDIIIFTSPQKHSHRIGHVGIVFSNSGNGLRFIQSTSGPEHCVTITDMDEGYKRRFVQVVRVLKSNDEPLVKKSGSLEDKNQIALNIYH